LTASGPSAIDSNIPAKGMASGQGSRAPSRASPAMAGVAVIIIEANRLARTMCPGEKTDMFPGALLELMSMIENSSTIERKLLQG
jgi:hypothetical protein